MRSLSLPAQPGWRPSEKLSRRYSTSNSCVTADSASDFRLRASAACPTCRFPKTWCFRRVKKFTIRLRAIRCSQSRNRPRFWIRHPAFDRPRDGQHHLLNQFLGIRMLKAPSPGQPVNDGLVQPRKLVPRLVILRVGKSHDQAGSRIWKARQSFSLVFNLPLLNTHPGRNLSRTCVSKSRSITGRSRIRRCGGFMGRREYKLANRTKW